MTPDEFRAIRKRLGETQKSLGERLGVILRSVQRYESGEHKISRTIEKLLLSLTPTAKKDENSTR